MVAPVIAGDVMARGILSNFEGMYDSRAELFANRMKGVCQLGLSTGQLQPLFGFAESPPMPERAEWGRAANSATFRYRTFTGINYRWTTNVRWLRVQRTLGQFGGVDQVQKDANRAGKRYVELDDLILSQILRETAGKLPSTLTAPDGSGLFAATDSAGADRFGVSGGNTVGSLGPFNSGVALQDAVFRIVERMQTFLDTQDQPLHPTISSITVILPAVFRQIAIQAFDAPMVPIGANTAASNAAVSNPFQVGDLVVNTILSARFTETNRIVVAIDDWDEPPIRQTVELAMESQFYDKANSPQHGYAGLEELMFESWAGWTLGPPLNICEGTA